MKKSSAILVALAIMFASCTKEPTVPETTYDETRTAEITVNRASYEAGPEGGSVTIKVKSSYLWKIEIPEEAQSWISVDTESGDSLSTYKVKMTVSENTVPSKRNAVVMIKSGKSKKRFTVSQDAPVLILSESDVENMDKYYKPAEFTFDMLRSDSKWSWCRSKQSEHFIVFWDAEYGEYGLYGSKMGTSDTSPSTCSSSAMKVDIDDLLEKAETFYDTNINKLKFAETGKGTSVLDKYKMEIYILYQTEWLATGSGYDNKIGALWVNPSTCHPVGSTIAHEIGHCFQYMVYCDYLVQGGKDNNQSGWRYGFGTDGEGGNCFWEQTAQWQSYQTYKSEAFGDYYADEFFTSTYLHVLHEAPRYANYFIHWWWVEQNDIEFIGKLWREAVYPEDPCETYMRLMGMDNAAFNDDMWKYAAHCVTFDMDEIRSEGKNYIGKVAVTSSMSNVDGYWKISATKAPESCGSNVVELKLPTTGSSVTADFQGLYQMANCHVGSATQAGWRYGFVAYLKDGSTQYSDIYSDPEGSATWNVPANTSRLWFVVSGAPKSYERHPWNDESNVNDNKWPWQAKFTNTTVKK